MADVSIIIVNYNTGELLRNCLMSIREHINIDYQVIVADNASDDGSFIMPAALSENRRFKFMQMGSNLGFARANNAAAKVAEGSLLHFLNPDTEVDGSLNGDYILAMRRRGSVYVNPLVNRDGSLENDKMPLPLLRDLFYWNFRRNRARIWYKGASVMMSREIFAMIGGWSEEYFLYAEDLDMFYKLGMYGIPTVMLSSRIYHFGGGSSNRKWNPLERETMVERSNRAFYKKYSGMAEYHLVKLYFFLHNLLKHPRKLPVYLKAWFKTY